MEKNTISSLAKMTREYLVEIEDNTSIKLHLQPQVCIFRQIAQGKILASLLRVISIDDTVKYDLGSRSDNHDRLTFIRRVFDKLKSNFVDIGFIAPLDVIECDEKLVFSLVKVLHHQIICRPDEKVVDRSLLEWVNYHTCFKETRNGQDLNSEKIFCDRLSEAGVSIEMNRLAFKGAEYEEMEKLSLECHNFSSDLKDGRVYGLLIARAFYFCISPVILMHLWNQEDSVRRIHYVIRLARFLGIENAITVNGILTGNIIANKLFIARLYGLHSMCNAKEKITTLQRAIRKCRDHIIELRITIQSLNIQNSQLQETYRRTVLDIENEHRREGANETPDAKLQAAISNAVKCIQDTIAPGINFEGDSFPEQMWYIYLYNLEIMSTYKNKVCELEITNDGLIKSNKVLKDIIAYYIRKQRSGEKKETLWRKLVSMFGCCTSEEKSHKLN